MWLARADDLIVERSGLSSTIRTPLADVLGVEVHRWRHRANWYSNAALRLREGSGRRFDAIPLGLPSSLASTLRDAERAAACLSVPRMPERDLDTRSTHRD